MDSRTYELYKDKISRGQVVAHGGRTANTLDQLDFIVEAEGGLSEELQEAPDRAKELGKMLKADLVAIATELSVEAPEKLTKTQVIKAIVDAETAE